MRWHGLELGPVRAGAPADASVDLENAGTVAWRTRGEEGVLLAYHWLDDRGNPIVWDGRRTPLPRAVEPGERLRIALALRGPIPPGRYRLAVDLVEEFRFWFADVGNRPLERDADVLPRIARRLAVRGGDPAALAEQEEPVVAEAEAEAVAYLATGAVPAADWSRRVLDAHQEGYGAVGGSIDAAAGFLRRRPRDLEPWAPGTGRRPRFTHPLLCPSVVRGVEGEWLPGVLGLPTFRPPDGEPWLYDGRISIRIRWRGSAK